MVRYLARLSIRIIIAFCLVVGTIRLIGALTPVPGIETIQQFNCTPKPCWHGIQLGVTTIQAAANVLTSDPNIRLIKYHPTDTYVCWSWQNDWHEKSDQTDSWDGCYSDVPNPDAMLILNYQHNPLRLGDAMLLNDRPVSSFLCLDANWGDMGEVYTPTSRITVNVPHDQKIIDPEFTVIQIVYFYTQRGLSKTLTESSWSGFFSSWDGSSPYCAG